MEKNGFKWALKPSSAAKRVVGIKSGSAILVVVEYVSWVILFNSLRLNYNYLFAIFGPTLPSGPVSTSNS